jgi:predicted HTH transcriptional regulator
MEEISGRVRTTVEVENVGVNGENVGLSGENVGVNEGNVGVNEGNVGLSGGNVGLSEENVGLNGMQEKIILFLTNDVKVTQKQIAEKLSVNEKTIERNMIKLKELGLIERFGSKKFGEWKILQKIEHKNVFYAANGDKRIG